MKALSLYFPRRLTVKWAFLYSFFSFLSLTPFFAVLTDGEKFLATRDLIRSFLPAKYFQWHTWFSLGHIPTWNPYVGGGLPFSSDISTGPYYFLNFVFPLLGQRNLIYAFSWYLALNLPLAFWGMLLFLRSFHRSRKIAVLFAFSYSISAIVVSSVSSPNVLAAMALLPFYFGCLRLSISGMHRVAGLGAALALVSIIFAGAPDYAVFAALCSPFFLLRKWKSPQAYLALAAVLTLAFLLALPVMLPFLAIVNQSKHAEMSLPEVMGNSFHPMRIFELFLPEIWGNFSPINNYIGKPFVSGIMDFPLIFNCYLGFFVPTFLYLALARKRLRPIFFPCLAFTLLLLIALGSRGWIYPFLATHISYWRGFRYPEKWMALANLPMFLLLSSGFQRMRALIRAQKIPKSASLPLLLFVPITLFFTFGFRHELSIKDALLRFLLMQCLLLIVFFLVRKKLISMSYFFPLVFLMVATDHISNSINFIWPQPISILENSTADSIKRDIASRRNEILHGGAYRIFTQGDFTKLNQSFVPENLDFIGRTAWISAKNFIPNVAELYDLSDVSLYSGISSNEHMLWWNTLAKLPSHRLLDLLGAYYFVKAMPEIGFDRNMDALPFVSSVENIVLKDSFDQVLQLLPDPSWDPKLATILESHMVPNFTKKKLSLRVDHKVDEILIRLEPNQIDLMDNLLLVNESYSAHWKCEPSCELLGRANGWAMLIYVKQWPEGGIRLSYR